MPNIKFTQTAIDGLKPPREGRVYYWDTSTPGFGLRIAASGKRTWVAQYRIAGKSQMETIAPVSDIPAVKDARERAQKSRVMARDGIDPMAEKRAQKQAEKQAEVEQVTFGETFDRYLREYCERNLRPRSLQETERAYRHDIEPTLGKRPLSEITRKDIQKLSEDKASTRERPHKHIKGGAAIMANRNLAKLRVFFGWCLKKELITVNPAIGVDRLVKETTRERILEDDEIKALWHATADIYQPYGPILRLLLLTGQRRTEVSEMRWSELNLDKQQWTIPRERAKNGKTHIVHLSEPVMQIIEATANKGGDLLFPSGVGRPVTGFAQMKPVIDKKIANLLRRSLEPWVIHDLRRTCASGMAQLGIAPHVLDRVLNHTAGSISGVAAIYNRHEYLNERRDALDQWAARVEELATKVKRAVLAA
jgi:integrase